MVGKGIGAVKGGISYCGNTRNIYSVHPDPKPDLRPVDLSAYGITPDNDLEQTILNRLGKSKVSNGFKAVLKYICIGLFTPFYFLLYCIPKLIWDNALHPIISALVRFFTPPVQASIRFVNRVYNRVYKFLQRRKEQLVRMWQACVDAINRAVLRIVVPVKNWVSAKYKRVQEWFHKVLSAIFNPILSFLKKTKERIQRKLEVVAKIPEKKIQSVTQNVHTTTRKVTETTSHVAQLVSKKTYHILLMGGLKLNYFLRYIVACFSIIPRYLFQISKEITQELRQWFSFR